MTALRHGFYHFRVIMLAIVFMQVKPGLFASCADRSIAVENKYIIPDNSFTASSFYSNYYKPFKGRLNDNYGWRAKHNNDPNDYLQIDLGYPYVICAVATKGGRSGWVTNYMIATSLDGSSWTAYKNGGDVKTFVGNTNTNRVVKHSLEKPLVRYIRFVPTTVYSYKAMRVGIYGYQEVCMNLPLGMQSGVIQDSSIAVSSAAHPAKNARLHYTSGSSWCASTSDSSPYLQIDLGSSHLICALATQGNSVADQWVKTYQIKTSTDGTTWTTYHENNTDRVFYSNYDRSTVVREVLYHGIVTRYLRIVPKTYQTGTPCLRTEIYGYRFQSGCSSHSAGIPSSILVPNHRFRATSVYNSDYLASKGRLGAYGAWLAYSKYGNDYLQIDLGDMFYICAVATQGTGYNHDEYVKKYKVLYSTNNNDWITYRETSGVEKEFTGNVNRYRVNTNLMTKPFKAKFVRVFPTDYNKYKSIRVEFKGLVSGCVSSLGLENSQIPDSQMTSSSSSDKSHSASRGRLYGGSSWCSSTASNTEYIQVDLGQVKTVTGIATQGDDSLNKWVTSYKVSCSFDNSYWNEYTEGQVTKVFNGNKNGNGVIVNWLNRPIAARYVKIFPQTSRGGQCIRLDFYGCTFYISEAASNQVTPDKRSVVLRWNNIQTNDGTAKSFFIEIYNTTGLVKKYPAQNHPINSLSIINLKPYSKYEIKMEARKTDGRPLWRSVTKVTTLIAVPEAIPSITAVTATSSQNISFVIKLTQADLVNGPINGYRITYGPQDVSPISIDVIKNKITLTNLEKYTNYGIVVAVRNTLYVGPRSKVVYKRTLEDAPSCAPTLSSAQAISSTSIRLTWTTLPNRKCTNGILRGYKVLYSMSSGGPTVTSTLNDPNKLSKDIVGLDKYTRYAFQVLGYTVKDGPLSNYREETTQQDAPSKPLDDKWVLLPPKNYIRIPRVRFTWRKPQEENGIITRYTIVYYYVYDSKQSAKKTVNVTDLRDLEYTTDALGQARLNFKISATTIKEGPYTTFKYGNIPVYPPAIAPRETRSTKVDETTFEITWQPLSRDQSNGVVTKYGVTWILVRVGQRKRRSVGQSATTTTQGTQYTINNLRLCAQYTVHVRGFTMAGAGPNSTINIVTSQPGEPLNLLSSRKGKRTIDLRWDKPIGVSQEIKIYKIIMTSFKSYWKEYKFSDNFTQEGGQTNKKFQNLQPGTSYEFWVISITECGESNKSVPIIVNTDFDAPVQPKVTPIKLKDNLNVTLWQVKSENGPITSYHVIVINGEREDVNDLPEVLHNYKDAKEKNQEFYITAELKSNYFSSITERFPIGNNKMYGGYKNVPLEKGRTYTIAERAITKDNKETFTGRAAKIATIKLSQDQSTGGQSRGNPVTGTAIGSVFAVLFIIACVVVGIIVYRRRRQPKDNLHESSIALDDMEDNERYERDSIDTIESKEDNNKYLNVVDEAPPSDDIYDQTFDNKVKPIPVRQFAEYVKATKATDYARLKEEFKKIPNAQLFSTSVAKKPVNKKKNRYGNIITYNHSRVVIESKDGDEDSDYVNASYISGFDGSPKVYIASQGPLPITFPDFWQMIWEQNTCIIVMLTNLKELGKTKCHQYWPEGKETYGDVSVNNHKTEVFPDYIIRTLLLTKTNSLEKRHILHFQFTVWPDKGVPHYATAVLGLRRKVKTLNPQNPQNAGPVVVHCSAGVGRTGCYIVIDAMLERAKKLRNVDISNYVATIRKARPYMVQTDEQYVFIYMAVLEVLTCGNTEIQTYNLQTVLSKLSTINQQNQVSGFAAEFERLNLVTADYAEDDSDIGRSKENKAKNRYPDVITLNSSRVLLTREDANDQDTDYINASFIHAYRERNAFIVTQAPLQNTVEDFWLMVVNYEIRTIVILNALQEDQEQFCQYWPQKGSQSYGHVTVELLDTQDIGDLVSRRFKVIYKAESKHVQHLQHTKWPDKSIPANTQSVLDLLNEVEQSQRQANNAPIVVQCSNGVGRSGTFCAISSILERMKQEQVIDVFQVVKCIRANRPGVVESLTQYIFCYQIIQKYLDLFSDYANFSNH